MAAGEALGGASLVPAIAAAPALIGAIRNKADDIVDGITGLTPSMIDRLTVLSASRNEVYISNSINPAAPRYLEMGFPGKPTPLKAKSASDGLIRVNQSTPAYQQNVNELLASGQARVAAVDGRLVVAST